MTDYDDFKQFGGGSVVAAYGMPAPVGSQRFQVGPAPVPNDLDTTKRNIEQRIAWLENELRMHRAWTEELATLKRMLASMTPPQPERTER